MAWRFYTPTVTPSIGTALPSNPVDGQEFTLVDSLSAPTYSWKLRYVAAKASNKWVFVGGPPLEAEVATSEACTSTSYAALATAGPSVTLPVAGDYFVAHGFQCDAFPASAQTIAMSYDIGGTAAVDADQVQATQDTSSLAPGSRLKKKAGLTAVTLTAKYKVAGGVSTKFAFRWISVTPVALGG